MGDCYIKQKKLFALGLTCYDFTKEENEHRMITCVYTPILALIEEVHGMW